MKPCDGCDRYVPNDARFCPNCGRDQTAVSPPQHENRIPTRTVAPPPREPGAGQTVVRGMGYTLGGCLLLVLIFFVVPAILLAGCMVIGAASGG